MDWISFDVETTGLDNQRHQILEIGAVTKQGQAFECLVWHEEWVLQPGAFKVNEEILRRLADVQMAEGTEYLELEDGTRVVRGTALGKVIWKFLEAAGYAEGRWNFAAKNPQFDFGFLSRVCKLRARRRFLDPGILWVEEGDQEVPDLATCMKRAGMEGIVTHRALDDAKVVRELLLMKGF